MAVLNVEKDMETIVDRLETPGPEFVFSIVDLRVEKFEPCIVEITLIVEYGVAREKSVLAVEYMLGTILDIVDSDVICI